MLFGHLNNSRQHGGGLVGHLITELVFQFVAQVAEQGDHFQHQVVVRVRGEQHGLSQSFPGQ